MSTDTREEGFARRISHLYATDQQFADAQGRAIRSGMRSNRKSCDSPSSLRPFSMATPTGRTSAELLPRFETITYRELSERVVAVAAGVTQNPVRPDDRVAVLGVTSIDYATVDMALLRLGAVAVPLQTSAPLAALRPIAAETEPVVIASSVEFLDDAVELVLTGHLPQRLVVFDYHGEVDDDRDAMAAATTRLAGNPVSVETLADVLTRGGALPTPPWVERDDGIGLDEYVDWLIEAGFPVGRVAGDYAAWLQRFETAVRALPERQRQASLLPLLHNYQRPETPILGSIAPTDRFRSAVRTRKLVPARIFRTSARRSSSSTSPTYAWSGCCNWPLLAASKWPIFDTARRLPSKACRFANCAGSLDPRYASETRS
jgi:hypothetical protein